MNTSLAAISFLNSLFSLLPALYVYFRGRDNALHRSFFFFAFSVSLWSLFYGIWQMQLNESSALFWIQMTMVPCYFIVFAFFWFVLTLVEYPRRKLFLPYCTATPLFFASFSFSHLTILNVKPRLNFLYWPTAGPLIHLYVTLYALTLLLSFTFLFLAWKKASGERRWQLKWITLTLLIGWFGGTTSWFLWYDIPIPPIAHFFVSIMFLILAYAIIRRGLLDVDTLADIIREAKLSAMGTMAASLNHELRNPLYIARNVIETHQDKMARQVFSSIENENAEARKVLDTILNQLNRAFGVMQQFTQRARPFNPEQKIEILKLDEIIEEVIGMIVFETAKQHVAIEREYDKRLTIKADRRQLEEIFYNLILNACQAMKEKGGTLTVKAHRHCEEAKGRRSNLNIENEIASPTARNDEQFVTITLSDTGPGVAKDHLNRIFEPFFTTKMHQGTGLGLYIVKQLVTRNAGKISVSSPPGQGTTFAMEFEAGQ